MNPAHPLNPVRAVVLAAEINALGDALAACHGDAGALRVYGRIDDLIHRRRTELHELEREAIERAQASHAAGQGVFHGNRQA